MIIPWPPISSLTANMITAVITGAMWKGETPEVRAEYHQKALEIKAHLMSLYPNYRYAPRKSSEIRRRAPRRPPGVPNPQAAFQHNAHQSPVVNNVKAGLSPTSEITRRIPGAQQFLPPVETPGWTPYHLLANANGEVPAPDEDTAAEDTAVQDAAAEDVSLDDAPEEEMNTDQEFESAVDRFMENWDIEAELVQIMAEV